MDGFLLRKKKKKKRFQWTNGPFLIHPIGSKSISIQSIHFATPNCNLHQFQNPTRNWVVRFFIWIWLNWQRGGSSNSLLFQDVKKTSIRSWIGRPSIIFTPELLGFFFLRRSKLRQKLNLAWPSLIWIFISREFFFVRIEFHTMSLVVI